jgi:multidrug efflux system outer membrane protein
MILILMLCLGACALGPDYRRPDIDTPSSWRTDEKETKDVVNTLWWEQFDDAVLNDLIVSSLMENKDLKIAAARVEQYIGAYWTDRAALFPQIGYTAQGGQQRVSENQTPPLSSTMRNPFTLYQGYLSGSWEIDIWGKLRRATEAARADLLSTEEYKRGVLLSLVSSVATGYVRLRDLDKQLEIAKETARSREDSYKLFTLRFEGGVISELELSQVKSEYEQALARIPYYEKQIAYQENALCVLLGRNPGPIPRGKTIDALTLPPVPQGLPSDLLTNRPDIRQAEQNLIAANARIGVARALYFPAISLTGVFGWSSLNLSQLFSGPAKQWSWAAGTVTAPLFTGGAIIGQNITADAVQQEMLFTYQRAIQNAFREVDDALIDQRKTREQLDVQKRQVEALTTYARVARLRFDNGYTSYIEVLDAERSLFNAQLEYAQTQGTLFTAFVNLYKAMGGGWVMEGERMSAVPATVGEE